MWRVIFLITCFVIICGVQFVEARPTACIDGETHWCKSEKTAKKCDKLKHCKKVWNPVIEVVIKCLTTAPPPTLRPGTYASGVDEARHAIFRPF